MLRGSPDNLLEFQIFIINIEILLVNFYLYKQRIRKRLPIKNNLYFFLESTRETLKKVSRYKKAWFSWLGGRRDMGRVANIHQNLNYLNND